MADSDPISEATPRKRQKLAHSRPYNSEDDSGDELNPDDFATVATMPLASQKRKLAFPSSQMHSELSIKPTQQTTQRHLTQPTQTLNPDAPFQTANTQPTQLLVPKTSSPTRAEVLVDRSSPPAPSQSSPPPKSIPAPIRKAPFAKPSFLANAMAPPGTAFRRPVGVQPRPAIVDLDLDSDDDPPLQHSSDEEETQNALRPTNFKHGHAERDLQSVQRKEPIVTESPRPKPSTATSSSFTGGGGGGSVFLDLMATFAHKDNKSGDDSASLNAAAPRLKPGTQPTSSFNRTNPSVPRTTVDSLDSIRDLVLRRKVTEIRQILSEESVQRCVDALKRKKGNVQDAIDWLTDHAAAKHDSEVDELTSQSPVVRRGLAVSSNRPVAPAAIAPIRSSAKQQVKAPTQTIAEKYRQAQAARPASQLPVDIAPIEVEPSDEEEVATEAKPRRRLQQGRKPGRRSPTPLSSPIIERPQPAQRKPTKSIVISDDEDEDSASATDDEEISAVDVTDQERRLLKFFNECSVRDIVDLCNQPEDQVQFVLDQRPFTSIDAIREITQTTETKSGKRSKARPVGDKLVDMCSEMRQGFDAIEELVDECERIAKPIQTALKNWGVGALEGGELQLAKLDEVHDSGIGTPASSCPPDDVPAIEAKVSDKGKKTMFLTQPASMNPDMTLKDYQLVALNWLNLLWSKKISCILADDMGLGKTCQIIAFLAHLQEQKVDGVHLIIVPGSTLENWLREFQRFAPDLQVRPYYGSQSERAELRYSIEEDFSIIDVIITTYDIAVKPDDNRFLRRNVDPLVTVYDEAHMLRNRKSNRYSQLIRIPATFRVLLTGTPLQNNLQELVAILAFIMPNLFAQKEEELQVIFKHKASTKDTDHAALLSSQRIARARSMITPFILRRKKDQVLKLPTKHRRVEFCDMTESQADYYAELMDEARQIYADRLEGLVKPTAAASKTGATTLMALREVAIHPLLRRRLYDDKVLKKIATELLKREWSENTRDKVMSYLQGTHPQSFKGGDFGLHRFCAERADYLGKFQLKKRDWMDSGKIAAFASLVQNYAANGDRVLVFSQFTSLMDILEAVLDSLALKFMRLDGSTEIQIRQDLIDTFERDTSIPVFLLSTKAGGAGLNLACANKVLIFDSGFNPQDDIQAENRAHRVGQTREVEVVRLVTRGSIEEQIYALGESKLALDERVSASADDPAQAEKEGAKRVEEMFLSSLAAKDGGDGKGEKKGSGRKGENAVKGEDGKKEEDLTDAFKAGLERAGVTVKSRQARF